MAVTWDTFNGVAKLAAASDEIAKNLPVQFIYLYAKAASAGDDYLVTDSDDNEIYRDVATGVNYTRIFPVNRRVNGVKLATMDTSGGYVVVILDKKYGLLSTS